MSVHPLMQVIEKSQLRSTKLTKLPELCPGYTVRVEYRIVEGDKERVQPFIGVIIRIRRGERKNEGTFTVRKVTQGHGVERIFPLQSPRIEKIEIMKKGHVRRAKLYYLRKRKGKAARLREKISFGKKSNA